MFARRLAVAAGEPVVVPARPVQEHPHAEDGGAEGQGRAAHGQPRRPPARRLQRTRDRARELARDVWPEVESDRDYVSLQLDDTQMSDHPLPFIEHLRIRFRF